MITFVIFFGACVGLAETKHFYQLLILRCVQSTGSASTVAIGAGVIGDITTREERGGYMGIFQAGLLVPLAAGPILGGVFAEKLGWRAIFWFLTIYSGVFLLALIILLPETLRSLVGNGSLPPKGLANSPMAYFLRQQRDSVVALATDPENLTTPTKIPRIDFLGPLRIVFGGEVSCAIFFLSIYYTVWQMTVSAMSTLFQQHYGLSELEIGLTFLANGMGCILGTLSTGKLLDHDYRKIKAKYSGSPESFPLERARLRTIWLWSAVQCASSLIFGWTLDKSVHLSVPVICTFFLGWAATSIQSVITTFLVDVFPHRSASAIAALNLARCLLGAGGTAAVLILTDTINVGWTFTLLTGIMLAAIGLLLVQTRYGAKWRQRREAKEMDEQ